MHSVVISVKMQPGKRDEVVELWKQHLSGADLNNEDIAHVALVLDDDDDTALRLVEFYTTREGFDNVMQTPEVGAFIEAAGPFFASAPEFARGTPVWAKNLDLSVTG